MTDGITGGEPLLQLYGVDPTTMGEAIKIIESENLADHANVNLGCPPLKSTS